MEWSLNSIIKLLVTPTTFMPLLYQYILQVLLCCRSQVLLLGRKENYFSPPVYSTIWSYECLSVGVKINVISYIFIIRVLLLSLSKTFRFFLLRILVKTVSKSVFFCSFYYLIHFCICFC